MKNKEKDVSLILKNFIDELTKAYEMSNEEKDMLEKLASEDTTKLFYLNDDNLSL